MILEGQGQARLHLKSIPSWSHEWGPVHTLAGGDTLTDTGVIHGDVRLGNKDTFDLGPGGVTGAITASSNDLFEFGGYFGNETVDDFVAGTGPSRDTIEFALGAFGSYAQAERAMAQVGSDVVIRLGATDSITLSNVALSNLVPADFKFV